MLLQSETGGQCGEEVQRPLFPQFRFSLCSLTTTTTTTTCLSGINTLVGVASYKIIQAGVALKG
ncbi:hypothetical protein E2C01_075939 [Portunus trituberculatus]|uniref:Uncharacterized protein n=1 Tax=Portunus trituberculatus TaxID=210409 RepID=A0A5B7I7F7_PORTR|nr:hypothetical protein [Portunus trituberculatus]